MSKIEILAGDRYGNEAITTLDVSVWLSVNLGRTDKFKPVSINRIIIVHDDGSMFLWTPTEKKP